MATIKDVANRAGVSTATVSYVINKSRFVSDRLTERVNRAIEELSFTPSKVAQSLRRGTSTIIGLVTDDITNRFASEFTKGLQSVASQEQYSIIISDLQEDPENEARSIGMLVDQKVEGIIYAGYGKATALLEELYAAGLPVVVVDKPVESSKLPSVLIDNRASIGESMEYLRKIGRTDILFINGLRINRNGILRAEAFREYLLRRRLPSGEDRIIWGDYTIQHGYQAARQLLAEKKKFDALLCGDDIVAFGAMAALKAKGIRIPEQVAVVGFDNDPMAPVFDPSLTTIHYPMYEMGRACFALFRKIAARKKTALHLTLETRLVVRRSTDPNYREFQYLNGNP
jgi:DNA-binding LacI/PurR family transcriptional regulator